MARLYFLVLLALLATGCNGTVKNFVKDAVPPRSPASNAPPVSNGPMTLKVSPGNVESAGTTLSMKATVTPTNRVLKSTNISAQISIHQQRVTP